MSDGGGRGGGAGWGRGLLRVMVLVMFVGGELAGLLIGSLGLSWVWVVVAAGFAALLVWGAMR